MTEEQKRISGLVLAILGLLHQQARSGYDLRKVFASTAMGHFTDSPGAIYPALKRCQRDGWLKGVQHNRTSRRPRQVFSLTAKGLAVLKAQLSQPITRDDIIRIPGELILRFVFSGDVLGLKQTRQFLREYLSEIQAYLDHLRLEARASRDKFTTCGRLAMEHGIAGYETDARWARRALKEL
jgi:DNA-binding PadR family transcriptional regulator